MTVNECLQGERVYPCARDTLPSGFRLPLVYKQISLEGLPYHLVNQPRSQGSLLPAPRSKLSRSVGRVGENPGNEVAGQLYQFYCRVSSWVTSFVTSNT